MHCQAQTNSMRSWRRCLSSEFLTFNTFHTAVSNSRLLYCYLSEDHRTATSVWLFLFKHPFPGCQFFSYTTSHVAVPSHSLSFLLLRDHCKNSWRGRLISLAMEQKQLWKCGKTAQMIHLAALLQPFSCFSAFPKHYLQITFCCGHADETVLMHHGKEKRKL